MDKHTRIPGLYDLPNKRKITWEHTHHAEVQRSTSIRAIWWGVLDSLDRVFKSRYRKSREDIEAALLQHIKSWQQEVLMAYFYMILWEAVYKERQVELEEKIAAFPERNWTESDWAVFWDIAPQPVTIAPRRGGTSGMTTRHETFNRWFDRETRQYTGGNDEGSGRGGR